MKKRKKKKTKISTFLAYTYLPKTNFFSFFSPFLWTFPWIPLFLFLAKVSKMSSMLNVHRYQACFFNNSIQTISPQIWFICNVGLDAIYFAPSTNLSINIRHWDGLSHSNKRRFSESSWTDCLSVLINLISCITWYNCCLKYFEIFTKLEYIVFAGGSGEIQSSTVKSSSWIE